jgi:hypothetical protein
VSSAAARSKVPLHALLLLGALVPAVCVGEKAVSAGPPADLNIGAREIDDAVCADWLRADTWNKGWAVTFALVAVGSAGYAALAPSDWIWSDHRAGLYVTAVKAAVGTVAKLVAPLDIDVEGLCRDPHPASAKARRALLSEAARGERRALTLSILGGLAINTAGLLYLGYGRGDWESAWTSFGIGTAVGVASTLTAPIQSWFLNRRQDRAPRATLVPVIGRDSSGLALAGTW